MTHTQFKLYTHNVGITFATRMALQEGVHLAQIQLWIAQAGRAINPNALLSKLTAL